MFGKFGGNWKWNSGRSWWKEPIKQLAAGIVVLFLIIVFFKLLFFLFWMSGGILLLLVIAWLLWRWLR